MNWTHVWLLLGGYLIGALFITFVFVFGSVRRNKKLNQKFADGKTVGTVSAVTETPEGLVVTAYLDEESAPVKLLVSAGVPLSIGYKDDTTFDRNEYAYRRETNLASSIIRPKEPVTLDDDWWKMEFCAGRSGSWANYHYDCPKRWENHSPHYFKPEPKKFEKVGAWCPGSKDRHEFCMTSGYHFSHWFEFSKETPDGEVTYTDHNTRLRNYYEVQRELRRANRPKDDVRVEYVDAKAFCLGGKFPHRYCTVDGEHGQHQITYRSPKLVKTDIYKKQKINPDNYEKDDLDKLDLMNTTLEWEGDVSNDVVEILTGDHSVNCRLHDQTNTTESWLKELKEHPDELEFVQLDEWDFDNHSKAFEFVVDHNVGYLDEDRLHRAWTNAFGHTASFIKVICYKGERPHRHHFKFSYRYWRPWGNHGLVWTCECGEDAIWLSNEFWQQYATYHKQRAPHAPQHFWELDERIENL